MSSRYRVRKTGISYAFHPSDIIALLKTSAGLLKGRPPATRTIVILNKVLEPYMGEARNLADGILKYGLGINSVICGELNKPHQLLLFS